MNGAPLIQKRPSGEKTEREKIRAALKSKDPSDVKAIEDVNQATEREKLELIAILLDQFWVGPRDERKLEKLWSSFGDQLPRMMTMAPRLWAESIERGAELEEIKESAVSALKSKKSAREKTIKAVPRKSLSEVGGSLAEFKHASHDLQVLETGTGIYEGNLCPTVTPGAIRTDCTEFVFEVLRETFAQQGRANDWSKVEKKYLRNIKARGAKVAPVKTPGKEGGSGLDVQAALQSELGWKGIYWAPDPSYLVPKEELAGYDPRTGKGIQSEEAISTLRTAKKTGSYYQNFGKKGYPGVSVAQIVTNYAPEMPIEENRKPGYPGASKTKKETTQLDKLKKLPFGVMTAHGGHHMMILTYGKVIEVHYEAAATSATVIQQTDFEKWAVGSGSGYHYFASGVIVAPATDVDAAFK